MKQVYVFYCIQNTKDGAFKSEHFEGDASIERLSHIMEQIEGAECFCVTMTCVSKGEGFRNVQISKSSVSDNAAFHLNTYNGLHEGAFGNDFFIAHANDISVSVLNALYVAMRDDKKAVIPFYQKGDD